MKKIILAVCVAASLLSCKKAKQLLDVTFSFGTSTDFTLPAIPGPVRAVDTTLTIKTPDVVNTVPDEFKKNKADINNLQELTIQKVTLNIKAPAGQTFDFLKSVKIYLGSTGKGDKLVATKENINLIDPSPITLDLDVQNTDIVEFIKGSTYYIRVEAGIVKTYTKDITMSSDITFKGVANPLN